MLNKKKTLEQLSMEKEEAERKDLRKLLDNQPATPGSEKEVPALVTPSSTSPILMCLLGHHAK